MKFTQKAYFDGSYWCNLGGNSSVTLNKLTELKNQKWLHNLNTFWTLWCGGCRFCFARTANKSLQGASERSTIVVTAKCNQFMQKAVPSFLLILPFSQFKPKAYFSTTASFLMLIISGKFRAALRLKVCCPICLLQKCIQKLMQEICTFNYFWI